MERSERRMFLRNSGLAITAAALGDLAVSDFASTQAADARAPIPSEGPKGLTHHLAKFIVSTRFDDIPETVRHEAKRTLLNWIGCAVGGCHEDAVSNVVTALAPFTGPGQATLFGRTERMDILNAALVNGISSHVLDFDDTHPETTIHPAPPVVPAIFALAEHRRLSGRDLMLALVIGVETECRIGRAAAPAHYEAGWHITGTAGVFGSAAAAGKLLGLNEQQISWAIGLAAAQPVGLVEMFGSMAKSYHPGRSAQNGLTAALLAERGFTASEQSLEAKFGWFNVLAGERKFAALTDNSWQILQNTYKPFPCGLVLHPAIDGCLQLCVRERTMPQMIARVDVAVDPRVMQIAAIREPKTGLEGKFSIYHAAAVALVEGVAGERQFSDEVVLAPTVVELRKRVNPTVDPGLAKDQARVSVLKQNGDLSSVFVEHAIGSLENPMTDRMIEDKFLSLVDGIVSPASSRFIIDACWRADRLADAAEIAASCVPSR
ncbi:MAG TPA: MmgE/PrpD family protein [Xanthobacteraceae bacterium]